METWITLWIFAYLSFYMHTALESVLNGGVDYCNCTGKQKQ